MTPTGTIPVKASATLSPAPSALNVFWDGKRVGTLVNEVPMAFVYDPAWLESADRMPLSPSIPLGLGKHGTPDVYAFFENLLPEGGERSLIAQKYQVSSVFGLLAMLGGDTAGALMLLPQDQLPQTHGYDKTTWESIARLLHGSGEPGNGDSDEPDPRQLRVSISGAQRKMLVSIDEDGQPLLPVGTTPSRFIVKPDIVHAQLKLFATAANETIVMRAARLCGLPTARVQYQPIVKACLVERYDRIPQPDGSLKRLWQADLCQIAGKPSDVKYENDGGPSFADCYALIRQHSAAPIADLRLLLQWLFFNLYVGNHDSHAKNLSILATGRRLRLAPFYDLMSTRVYSGLSPNFAFRIGGTFDPGQITPAHLDALAGEIGVQKRYLAALALEMAHKVHESIPKAVAEVKPLLDYSAGVLADRIHQGITRNARRISARLTGDEQEQTQDDPEDAPV